MNVRPVQPQPDDAPCESDPIDRLIESELSRRLEAPDMTRAIMGRLGYMRLSETAVRCRRRIKWVRRIATAACLGLVLGVGLFMHRESTDSRLPAGPTIPRALHNSLRQGGEQLDRAINSIRLFENFSVPQIQPTPETTRPYRPELERENQLPFRWV